MVDLTNEDLTVAKKELTGHTICLCKNGHCLYSEKKGIAPMMDFISDGTELRGFSVADLVVGKAAALLFVKSGIANVFAKVISESGKKILDKYRIYCEYEILTDKIVNRAGTDICPMEKAVSNIENPDEAYEALQHRIQAMREHKQII